MNSRTIADIQLIYERKRDRSERDLLRRKNEVYEKIPKIREIDDKIRGIGLKMAREVLSKPEKGDEIAIKAKGEIEALKMEKAFLLTEGNINADYLERQYECSICNDTGYLEDGKRCRCLKQEMANRAYKMSNLGRVLEKENFSKFNINLFSEESFEGEKLTPRENMADIAGYAEGFISNFDIDNGENLLFYGTTGLGKTFLCNCIAKALLDNNKTVVYQTAFTILDILERRRFRRDESEVTDYEYSMLFESDLLIIDDLGTEVSNSFTNAEIFNIVNTRLLSGKKTIISTNLTPNEISEIYTDRIFSRIFDKFIPLKFYGKDIRWEHSIERGL